MPKRSRKPEDDPLPPKAPPKTRPKGDAAQRALNVVEQAIGGPLNPDAGIPSQNAGGPPAKAKDPNAVALGRKGGLKGGKARAAKMTPEERRESAQAAAKARWKGSPDLPGT